MFRPPARRGWNRLECPNSDALRLKTARDGGPTPDQSELYQTICDYVISGGMNYEAVQRKRARGCTLSNQPGQ